MMDSVDIQGVIPHRFPFMLVDRIQEIEPGKRIVGLKCVSSGEFYFQGHFPGNPIMPGVIIVEALAQTAGICVGCTPEYKGCNGLFVGIESMKFRRLVVPGDQLRLEAEILSIKLNYAKARVVATVEGQVAAEGEIRFVMMKRDQNLRPG